VVIAVADVYAQIPSRDAVREVMRLTQERAREQPGCVSYTVAEALEDPGHFVVVQQWRDQGALDVHYRSEAFADYQAGVAKRLVHTTDLRVYEVNESFEPVDSSTLDLDQDD
jgi:quinol monooxygenase YgiN